MASTEKDAQPAPAAAAKAEPAAKDATASPAKDKAEKAERKLAVVSFPSKKPEEERAPKAAPKSKSIVGRISKLRFRHVALAASFLLIAAVPTAATSFYMIFIAADQYHSSASFSVRSIDGATGSDILGLFTQASTGDTTSDSYILADFIQSRAMVDSVRDDVDIEDVFAQRGGDWYFSLEPGQPIEDVTDYWNSMTHVEFDNSSGIINVQVRSFDPQSSVAITEAVVQRSEALINDLSEAARSEVLLSAQREVEIAEERLREARAQVRQYRDLTQEVDPGEAARLTSELIGALEQQLSQAQAELNGALSQMGPDSPRVRVLQTTIRSLEAQIQAERSALGRGADGEVDPGAEGETLISDRIQRFEELETEREFAERSYTSALAALQSARMEASNKQRYLAVFSRPALSEEAQYPRRWLAILLVAIGSVFVWAMGVLGYYNIRDRA